MRNSELGRPDDDSALKMKYTDNVSLPSFSEFELKTIPSWFYYEHLNSRSSSPLI